VPTLPTRSASACTHTWPEHDNRRYEIGRHPNTAVETFRRRRWVAMVAVRPGIGDVAGPFQPAGCEQWFGQHGQDSGRIGEVEQHGADA
jgi:hypothetical protein